MLSVRRRILDKARTASRLVFILLSIGILQHSSLALAAPFTSGEIGSIIGGTPFYDPNAAACGDTSSATTAASNSSSGSLYILGDSITKRVSDDGGFSTSTFKTKFPSAFIDGDSSRSLTAGGSSTDHTSQGNSDSGLQAIEDPSDTSAIQSADVIVIELGTNGGDTTQNIDQAISEITTIKGGAPSASTYSIYWVDTFEYGNPGIAKDLSTANANINSQSSIDGYTVLPWAATAAANPQKYIDTTDGYGVHPSQDGAMKFADLITTKVSGAGGQTGTFTSLTGDQAISGTFILGFSPSTPKSTIKAIFTQYKPAGIFILGTTDAAGAGFDAPFFKILATDAGHPIITASDEEGIFHRYIYSGIDFKNASQMGSPAMTDKAVHDLGEAVGKVMVNNGLNTDLAPVLDVATDSSDTDAGTADRAFSDSPNIVAQKAGDFAAGLQAAGINPTYKHFPGLGSVPNLSTDKQSVTTASLKDLVKKDLVPYGKIVNQNGAAVMMDNAHIPGLTTPLGKPITPASPIASTSPKAVELLRQNYHFNGLIMTDDLTARGVGQTTPTAVKLALQAGVDTPLFTYTDGIVQSAISAARNVNTGPALQALDQFLHTSSAGTPTNSTPVNGGACCNSQSVQTTGATTVDVSGSNVKIAYSFLVANGFTPMQSAGIVGNLMEESGVNPTQNQIGGGGGYGIAQWTPPTNMIAWVSASHGDPNSLGGNNGQVGQLDYLIHDLKTNETTALTAVKADGTVEAAATDFMQLYERPKVSTEALSTRINDGQAVYTKYGGQGSGIITTDASTAGCSPTNVTAASSGPCANPFRDIKNLRPERIDQGVDYAGTGPVYAVCPGKILNITDGTSPNTGWCYGGYCAFISIAISGTGTAADGKVSYMAEGCIPKVKIGDEVNTNTQICTLICNTGDINTCTGIETGWAAPAGTGQPLAQLYGGDGSHATAMGFNYNSFLGSLGVPSGLIQNPRDGYLPPGWPKSWTGNGVGGRAVQ